MTFDCDKCNKKYASNTALAKHKLLKHNEATNIKFYRCKECGNKAYVKEYGLAQHLDNQHKDIKSYCVKDNNFVCIVCDEVIKSVSTIKINKKYYRIIKKRCECYIPIDNGYGWFDYDSDDDPLDIDEERIEINEKIYKDYTDKIKQNEEREQKELELRKNNSNWCNCDFSPCYCSDRESRDGVWWKS